MTASSGIGWDQFHICDLHFYILTSKSIPIYWRENLQELCEESQLLAKSCSRIIRIKLSLNNAVSIKSCHMLPLIDFHVVPFVFCIRVRWPSSILRGKLGSRYMLTHPETLFEKIQKWIKQIRETDKQLEANTLTELGGKALKNMRKFVQKPINGREYNILFHISV